MFRTLQLRAPSLLCAAGLRPVQDCVPGTRRPGLAEECQRQLLIIAATAGEKELQDRLLRAAATEGWR
jgi:hypothetical protein